MAAIPAGLRRHSCSRCRHLPEKYNWDGPLYPCLDHGGPWLKDRHTLERLSLDETMAQVKHSLEACLEAGYQLLHIDPTVDRSLLSGRSLCQWRWWSRAPSS